MEDVDIIRQVLAGDHERFAVLVKRYQEPLWQFLRRILPSEQDVFDCAQEALIAAYRNLWRYSDKYTFRSWLYTIARNKAMDSLRQRQRAQTGDISEEIIVDTEPGPEEVLLAREQKIRVQEALSRLPDPYRQALYLRYHQELAYEEIAQVLQIPVSSVKTYLHRGKEKLRKILEEGYHDPAGQSVDPSVSR
ncbi:RNA polymerase sigma factor [Paradesulfitobacterium ferrireducens]|uniref:RNA polymerase sigma factor n=1 Tax=Paradesulfitobacterium ferrireducens TaxID=2816476 RepID=UPI001A8E1C69|nr:sigma-70 family RNA polymerase sigma factor [Paradesulfitobacterium ferrireducens]